MKDRAFKNNLVCPKCYSRLADNAGKLVCPSCNRCYPTIDGIPDFREKDRYWCNVSREKMKELNRLARDSGDWLGAANKVVPQYAGHFVPFNRADCQFLWPTTKDSRILDAGSMWGGVTIPAAQFHREVYALDKTRETLEFLKIRAQQMGFNNIHTVASGVERLPFPDNFFDLVILNGVLEWVAFKEEVVLERDWRKFGRGLRPKTRVKYNENPRSVQIRVLREAARVLKPGGALYLAIENRVGYTYLLGYPDDHMNIPFICFLPRPVANAITRLALNCDYRTYVYTVGGYKRLLKEAGFVPDDFYGAFMHYINPQEVVPLDLIERFKGEIVAGKGKMNKALLKCIPGNKLKWLAPSIIAIAPKAPSRGKSEPRLVGLLKKAGILNGDSSGIKIVKYRSRDGNDFAVNYCVCIDGEDRPKYFCKVGRKSHAPLLDAESDNIKQAGDLLKDTELASSIPRPLYHGTLEGITFTVTDFVKGRRSAFNFNGRIKKKIKELDREIKIAVKFLADFQRHTATREVEAAPYLLRELEERKKILEKWALLDEGSREAIEELKTRIANLGGIKIRLSAQQGDYDFFYNILFDEERIKLLDFEHFQTEALPFLDLATLLFNPLLVSYEYKKNNLALGDFLKKYRLKKYLNNWLNLYAKLSSMSEELLPLIPALAALEQRTRNYPASRDPETFPINKVFKEFLVLR